MEQSKNTSSLILAAGILLGLVGMGLVLANAVITFKEYERTVTVKGLAEQEYLADVVIWPIQFTEAANNLEELYVSIEQSNEKIVDFLKENGVSEEEISVGVPNVTDKQAQQYGGERISSFRYVASQVVTVYSEKVLEVRKLMNKISQLGKEGIAITGENYQYRTEYLFTRLNDIKPEMVEKATMEARSVAQKFAEDSNSKLGKIKTAHQGQFSIVPRDANNPHIKKIRVVSTIQYYLSD